MTLTPAMVTFDTTDVPALSAWWTDQTGAKVLEVNEWFAMIALPSGMALGFQKVAEPTPGKNRIHVDFSADDAAAEVARLESAGATRVGEHAMGDFSWVVLADPDGNQFCVSASH